MKKNLTGTECIGGDGLVSVGPRGDRTCRVDEVRACDLVYSPSLGRAVTVVATVKSALCGKKRWLSSMVSC